jgi:hypothetical protein
MTHIITAVAIVGIPAAIVLGIKLWIDGPRAIRRALCHHEWLPRYEEDYCPKCDRHRWH